MKLGTNESPRHVSFYSGGIGSWKATKRIVERHGVENLIVLFTDTFIEDKGLYRFLIETTQEIFNIDCSDLVELTDKIPKVSHETMDIRKEFLKDLSSQVMKRNPSFVWTYDGRHPWEVFKDVRWIGNSRIAQCSHKLKQDAALKYIESTYKPDECVLYLGIDWTEDHRTKAPIKNWSPYKVEFPLCEEPYIDKSVLPDELEALNIKIPELYLQGFSHNNCGGFCVRAGQGHFINLLQKNPELFTYHEEKEQEMIKFLGKDNAILRRTKNGIRHSLTLKQLREEYEAKSSDIDMDDIGGCGCFVSDEE